LDHNLGVKVSAGFQTAPRPDYSFQRCLDLHGVGEARDKDQLRVALHEWLLDCRALLGKMAGEDGLGC
jgi:hypothetical protein